MSLIEMSQQHRSTPARAKFTLDSNTNIDDDQDDDNDEQDNWSSTDRQSSDRQSSDRQMSDRQSSDRQTSDRQSSELVTSPIQASTSTDQFTPTRRYSVYDLVQPLHNHTTIAAIQCLKWF